MWTSWGKLSPCTCVSSTNSFHTRDRTCSNINSTNCRGRSTQALICSTGINCDGEYLVNIHNSLKGKHVIAMNINVYVYINITFIL